MSFKRVISPTDQKIRDWSLFIILLLSQQFCFKSIQCYCHCGFLKSLRVHKSLKTCMCQWYFANYKVYYVCCLICNLAADNVIVYSKEELKLEAREMAPLKEHSLQNQTNLNLNFCFLVSSCENLGKLLDFAASLTSIF